MSEGFSLLIDVSAEDITNGNAENPYSCPIAKATPRANPGLYFVIVVSDTIMTRLGNQRFHAELPVVATDFIAKFDNHLPVSPFQFYAHFVPEDRGEDEEEGVDE